MVYHACVATCVFMLRSKQFHTYTVTHMHDAICYMNTSMHVYDLTLHVHAT